MIGSPLVKGACSATKSRRHPPEASPSTEEASSSEAEGAAALHAAVDLSRGRAVGRASSRMGTSPSSAPTTPPAAARGASEHGPTAAATPSTASATAATPQSSPGSGLLEAATEEVPQQDCEGKSLKASPPPLPFENFAFVRGRRGRGRRRGLKRAPLPVRSRHASPGHVGYFVGVLSISGAERRVASGLSAVEGPAAAVAADSGAEASSQKLINRRHYKWSAELWL
ncbi:CRACD-like protein [Ischnura elegans]|uniref:CRACD-like protein n=1 Tax=Ischnura elegans TaxID=197161 RepID=UPI001ED8BA1F|nr:CRACD-like protein [Ischnura elegans]